MDLTSKQDIGAPIADVFDAISDFPAFERQIMRRGADLRRLDSPPVAGVGANWRAQFQFRGRDREASARVTQLDRPDTLRLEGATQGMDFALSCELLALSRNQTRLTLKLNVAARTLTTRLLLQSLKLARGSVQRRLDKRVAQFAADIEQRQNRTPAPLTR